MNFSLTLGQSQRLEQRVVQLLKLELRQELRLVLEQILKILQRLVQKWEISMEAVGALNETMVELSWEDRQDIAHELVRRSNTWESEALQSILHFAGRQDTEFLGIRNFTLAIRDKLELRHVHLQRQAVTFGLRLILKRPEFMGGQPGEPKNLADLLESVPQKDEPRDRYEWILAGGWAVELLTGEHLRSHHDLDAVLLTSEPLYLDCDVVHTQDYFGVLSCTSRFIRGSCVQECGWEYEGNTYTVGVLCPEFLFLSKILCPPRSQDWDDVELLVARFSSDWDLDLIGKLIARNNCGFTQTRALLRILRTRDPKSIIDELARFR